MSDLKRKSNGLQTHISKSWSSSFHFQQYFQIPLTIIGPFFFFFGLNYSSNLGIPLGSKSYAYFHVRPSNPSPQTPKAKTPPFYTPFAASEHEQGQDDGQ